MVAVTLGGSSMRVAVSRGCPQPGVLSPLLWCLVVADLIDRRSGGGIYIQGYADDIYLPAVGNSHTRFRAYAIGPSNRRDMV